MSANNKHLHCFSKDLKPGDFLGEYWSDKDCECLIEVDKDVWAEMRANRPVTILEDYGDVMKVQSGHSVFQVKASCVCPVELE